MSDNRMRILGVPGSPYSRKPLAALRYRRALTLLGEIGRLFA